MIRVLVLLILLFLAQNYVHNDLVPTVWPLYPDSTEEDILAPLKANRKAGHKVAAPILVGKWTAERMAWADKLLSIHTT